MNKKQVSRSFLKKSSENFELYEFLSLEGKFIEWQAVSIFYSALCYVKAYLYSKPSIPERAISSHKEIMFWLTTEKEAKNLMIFEHYYNFLYSYSRDARYKCNKINQQIINKMLEKYQKIKELLLVEI